MKSYAERKAYYREYNRRPEVIVANRIKSKKWNKKNYKINKEQIQIKRKQDKENLKKYYHERYLRFRDKMRAYTNARWAKVKLEGLIEYSANPPFCKCCNEKTISFLTFEHSKQDGGEHRRQIKNNKMAQWLKTNKYPKDLGIEILCWNCQWGRKLHNGICPHITNA